MGEASRTDLGVMWDGTRALDVIREYVRRLRKRGVKVRAVVVIGSRARGDWRPGSDIDLVVVVDDERDLPKAFWTGVEMGDVEVRPYCASELVSRLRSFDFTLIEALECGVVITDDGIWERLRSVYDREVRRRVKLRLDETGGIDYIKVDLHQIVDN